VNGSCGETGAVRPPVCVVTRSIFRFFLCGWSIAEAGEGDAKLAAAIKTNMNLAEIRMAYFL